MAGSVTRKFCLLLLTILPIALLALPTPALSHVLVEKFFTAPDGAPLPTDAATGLPLVRAVVDGSGTVVATVPPRVIAVVAALNETGFQANSARMFDTLPEEFRLTSPDVSAVGAVHVSDTGEVLAEVPSAQLDVVVMGNVVVVTILNMPAAIGRALDLGESILFRLDLTSTLIGTSGVSFPRVARNVAEVFFFPQVNLEGGPIGQGAAAELIIRAEEEVPPPPQVEGRMTGGGSVFTDTGMRVTHGFELHCDVNRKPNRLQVNWHPGGEASHRFHLQTLTFAQCTDDPTISPNPPAAPFDTYEGRGTGLVDGQPGATAEWVFTDAGEPGTSDRIRRLIIRDASGAVVLLIPEPGKTLTFGNHQAHK
ncbi:MAG: hypothetical protein HY726_09275 [Candidatus Rokubacteria bacterium]|nr:hypothetical protein [Candidatus Rokubacteria bacterium]